MPFQQVSILGLGLIGASLGLALKRSGRPPRIVGFDTSGEALHRAARAGAIDRSAGTLADACSGSDVLILAAPVRAILQLLPEIGPHLTEETLVTDTGGTKQEIVRVADSTLPRNAPFVGGHPLAGRLSASVNQPADNLFGGAVYCLTPSPNAPAGAVAAAVELVESVGAQPYFLEASEHDALLAAISHLPYFVSVALVNALAAQSSWSEMGTMAAGGFRAASSLAEANPQMWADVAATNREALTRQLDLFMQRLTKLRELIESGDESLVEHLSEAQAAHQDWLSQRGEAAPAQSPTGSVPRSASWMDRFRRT